MRAAPLEGHLNREIATEDHPRAHRHLLVGRIEVGCRLRGVVGVRGGGRVVGQRHLRRTDPLETAGPFRLSHKCERFFGRQHGKAVHPQHHEQQRGRGDLGGRDRLEAGIVIFGRQRSGLGVNRGRPSNDARLQRCRGR